jgi:hypothetical protein
MGSESDAHRAPLQNEPVFCSGGLRPPTGGDPTLKNPRTDRAGPSDAKLGSARPKNIEVNPKADRFKILWRLECLYVKTNSIW